MASGVFTARWPFRCACCNELFETGTPAYYGEDDSLRNADPEHIGPMDSYKENGREPGYTLQDVMPRGKRSTDKCQQCFMIHASGQEQCE